MQRFEYTTIDRILNAFQRNLGDEDITEEVLIDEGETITRDWLDYGISEDEIEKYLDEIIKVFK